MPNLGTTPFSKKCEILGDLWLEFRDDDRQYLITQRL